MLAIVKQYAGILCVWMRGWPEKFFLFSLTIHTEVQLSYAVLRLPRNKFKFLFKKNTKFFKKKIPNFRQNIQNIY